MMNQIEDSPERGPLSFSDALAFLREQRDHDCAWIQRDGWNGKGLKVKLQVPDENSKMTLPYLYIEYPDGRRCPWLASQTDILTNDWACFWQEE